MFRVYEFRFLGLGMSGLYCLWCFSGRRLVLGVRPLVGVRLRGGCGYEFCGACRHCARLLGT